MRNDLKQFLKELTDLTNDYGIIIESCDTCKNCESTSLLVTSKGEQIAAGLEYINDYYTINN